jgi:hypothetical protein
MNASDGLAIIDGAAAASIGWVIDGDCARAEVYSSAAEGGGRGRVLDAVVGGVGRGLGGGRGC